jgi:hypothetical protein
VEKDKEKEEKKKR